MVKFLVEEKWVQLVKKIIRREMNRIETINRKPLHSATKIHLGGRDSARAASFPEGEPFLA